MSINYKAQLNGLRKTNWSNKTDNKKLKILEDKYEKLGRKVPKYLTNGKLTEKKLDRAIQSLENMYSRKIEQQTPLTNRLYNKYKNQMKQAREYVKEELKNYPKEVRDAYFKNNKDIIMERTYLTKQDLKINRLDYFKKLAKMQGVNINNLLREYIENDGVFKKSEYVARAKDLLDEILSYEGLELNARDKKELYKRLEDVGYLEYDFLMTRWQKRVERGYYVMYKDKYNLEDPDDLYSNLLTDILDYLPNVRTFKIE